MGGLFKVGAQFPPKSHMDRLATYRKMERLYANKPRELYDRALELLQGTEHEPQLNALYVAVNFADILATKPADMLVGEAPQFESGKPDNSPEQIALTSHVEENDLPQLIHESAVGAAIRGDSFFRVRYDIRQDLSEVIELGLPLPKLNAAEPIIEHVNASAVFPETSRGNKKRFKAINVAVVEEVTIGDEKVPFLNVERQLPGYIIYERYRMKYNDKTLVRPQGVYLDTYTITEKVATGKDADLVETNVGTPLIFHTPYKATDAHWRGISGLATIEPLIYTINDRLTQIDYILWKHADPNSYGPALADEGDGAGLSMGGNYLEVTKDDATPGYMTWDGQLSAAFTELETLIALVFQLSETPQWLFGTVLGDGNEGGTGTSHTDSAALKTRFMPILSKVARIRQQYDRAIRDALYACQLVELEYSQDAAYEPTYPVIKWADGLPRNEKEEAEIEEIKINAGVQDRLSAIKRLDRVDDEKAQEILRRIKDDEDLSQTVTASIFNETED